MKKIMTLLVVFALVLGLAGCGGGGGTAQNAVETTLKALKTYDLKTAFKHLSSEEFLRGDVLATDDDQIAKVMLENLTYRIIKSVEEGDTAVVTAEITNVDMAEVFPQFVSQLFTSAFSGKEMPEDETATIFSELVKGAKDKTTTTEVDIKLIKKDGQWQIEATEDFQDAVLGGMLSIANGFGDAFSGLED